jgi:hypothetical protein
VLSYAVAADLTEWLTPGTAHAPSEADAETDRQLLRASETVEGYVLSGYSTNADGTPHDEDVAAWLRDAACAQVEYWRVVSEEHGIGGVTTGTMSANGVSHEMPAEIGPRVLTVLDRAGLRSPIGNAFARYRTPFDLIAGRYP